MTKEIERAGIPIIHVTNLVNISEGIGTRRILKGNSVLHVFGRPDLPEAQEFKFRKGHLMKALNELNETPEEGKYSLVKE